MQILTQRETTITISGKEYKTNKFIKLGSSGVHLPVIELKQMSDLEWQKMALKSRIEHPELYIEKGEDAEAAKERLRISIAKLEEQSKRTAEE